MLGQFVVIRAGLFGNWVNGNPELKVNRNIYLYKCLCSFDSFKIKTEDQNINRKLHRKSTKLKSKFSIFKFSNFSIKIGLA